MQFQPKTEKEILEESLIPPGCYGFEVIKAEAKKSKAGNDMIELKLKVFEDADHGVFVTDYLMEAMAFKLLHFCSETGLMANYSAGKLTADMCIGKTGWVQTKHSKPNGDYAIKNEVKDYGQPKDKKAQPQESRLVSPASASSAPSEDDSDIPF